MLIKYCICCGEEKELDKFNTDRRSLDLRSSKCKICRNSITKNKYQNDKDFRDSCKRSNRKYKKLNRDKILEKQKEYNHSHKDKYLEYYATNKKKIVDRTKERSKTVKGRYSKYKYSANYTGRVFAITLEEFETFWQKPCFYCNSEIMTIGLDRIDSSKDYILSNVIPCCSICNTMKLDYEIDFFLSHIENILKRKDNIKELLNGSRGRQDS